MKLKNTVAAGISGAMLLLATTASYAATVTVCNDATITSVGAGYDYVAPNGRFYYIDLTCNDSDWSTKWPTGGTHFKFLPDPGGEVYVNMDGMYATALTAFATTKKVAFTLATWSSYTTTATGEIKAGTYIVNITVK